MDQLTSVTNTMLGNFSYAYDLSGNRTAGDHRYIWSGNTIAEERDSTGAIVTKRFFADGEQINGVNYYFTVIIFGSGAEETGLHRFQTEV